MPDEPPKLPPIVRPPVPSWMKFLFAFGLIPVGMLFFVATARGGNDIGGLVAVGAVCGLICGLPLLGGLALASRFFSETGARFAMGIVFALVITVGVAGVAFAGCVCLMGNGRL